MDLIIYVVADLFIFPIMELKVNLFFLLQILLTSEYA